MGTRLLSSKVMFRRGVTHINGSSEELDASLSDFLIAAGDVCRHGEALDKHTCSCHWVVSASGVSFSFGQCAKHPRLGKLAEHSERVA